MKCLESLIRQTYANFEIIVVNDGSTDSSAEIVSKISDKRIRLFNIENSGVSNARNFGLSKATGKFIAFVDPDDYVSEKYLEDMIIKMSDDVDLIVTGRIEVSKNVSITSDKINYCGSINAIPKEFFSEGLCHPIWGKLFKKEIIDRNNISFKNIKISEDSFFNLEYLTCSQRIIILPYSNYYYVKYDGNDNLTNKCDFSYINIYDELYDSYDYFFKHKCKDYTEDIIYPQFYNLIIKLVKKYPLPELYKNQLLNNFSDSFISVFKRENKGVERILCFMIKNKCWLLLKVVAKLFLN